MDKKKLEVGIKCIALIVAFILFFVVVSWAADYDKGTDTTYDVVCLGDSNFGNTRDESSITSLLGEKLDKNVLNAAFGGSLMTSVPGKKTEYHSVLSMHNMAISICNHNFGVQKASIDTIARTDYIGYFTEALYELADVDFDSVELLLIEHGVNDYMGGVPIKNGADAYDTDTFCGSLRSVITMFREEYPDLRIVLVTPAYCAPPGADGIYRPCDENRYGGGYLEDYVNAELEVAEEMGVEIIDIYHLIEMDSESFSTYLYDGLHFNEYGREIVADILADYLLGEAE